jgi:hypothetical protein
VITRVIAMEAAAFRQRLIEVVRRFDEFTADNDPYGEHDFGKVTLDGADHFFKIDYYDKDNQYGSEDASNPAITCRMMTIMNVEDY